jgi:hypothetical protein
MRLIPGFIALLILFVPAASSGQTVGLHGSAGPTIVDAGHSLAAGVGFSPASRITLLVNLERTHLSSRSTTDGRGGSVFRGGTLTLGTAELRVALFGRERVSPYVLAGFGAGVSRPNVNATFPDRVSNDVRALFFGGGVRVPLGAQVSVFGDARMMVGAEAGESLAVAPVRVGLAWRF